jgi:hypothetical protein
MVKIPARAAAAALTSVVALAVLPSVAFGQATRTWVSGVGDDVNPCSRTAPCKTFAGAISKTAAGGEINVLDSGGFGTLSITKSLTIRGRGVTAGMSSPGTNAITVNAGASDRVTIRGLDINGAGASVSRNGINGVRFLAGKQLRIDDCEIYGFTTAGVSSTPSTANARLIIEDSKIHNNVSGVAVAPTGGGAGVTVRNSNIDDNDNGVVVNGSTAITATTNVFRSSITDNGTGLLAFGALADIRIGSDDVTGNTTGLSALTSAKITSFGNNQIFGNGTDGAPTNNVLPK